MEDISEVIKAVQKIPAVPTILDVVCRTTGMGFAAVARVTEERWVACSVLDNIHFGLKPGGELVVESTLCHEIRSSRQAVVIDHVDQDHIYRDHHTPRQYGFQSYISMPIFLPDGAFFGTLCSIDPRPARVNTPEIIGMFKLFAELIGFHISTSEKLAHSESSLTREREDSGLREQFIGVLSHDLRTPLGAIIMGAASLRDGQLDEEQGETVAMMVRSAQRMSGLIDDALDLTRGRLGGGIALEIQSEAPIDPILKQVMDEVSASWPGREITTHFAITERLQYDPRRMAQLFSNLLSNAMTYGKPDQPVRVDAVTKGGNFMLSVANAAEPIPREVLERLFEPFSRGGPNNYQEGLGLGLYIASEIAKSHNGVLNVVSSRDETRFTLLMPVADGGPG